MKKSQIPSEYLASVCKSNPSFFAKLTISANYQKRTSHFIDAIALTLEYLQLYAQILLINSNIYGNKSSSSSIQLYSVLIPISRVIITGGLLKGLDKKETILELFIFFLFCMAIKVWAILHVFYAAKKGRKLHRRVGTIWNWIFHLQARIIYPFVVSFWVILVQFALIDKLELNGFLRYSLIIVPSVIMTLEVVLSIIIEQSLSYNLPTKRFLSRKASFAETITLIQKLINQIFLILYVKLTAYLMSLAWIAAFVSLGFCLVRDFYFFRCFPLYNTKALKYEGYLLVLSTAQSLAYVVQMILRVTYDESISSNFAIITWAIFGIFGVCIVSQRIRGVFLKLVMTTKSCMNPDLMVHKVFAVKDFLRKSKLPGHKSQNYSFAYLVSQTLTMHSRAILNLNEKDMKTGSITNPWNKYLVGYLEYLVEAFPKNNLTKLILGWFYIRKLGLYGPGIRILNSLIHSKHKSTAFNASLLIYQLEEEILTNYQSEKSKLDLGEYTRSTSAVINLKGLMRSQAKLQIKLCLDMSQSRPDLNKIFESAQSIYQARQKVEKKIRELFKIVPEYYLEPYKLCAYYNLSLNFSLEEYAKYEKLYSRLYHKYNKVLSSRKELTQKTIFHKDSNIFLICGAKASTGLISYNSKGYHKFVEHSIKGTHIGTLCPKSVRKFYTLAFNTTLEEGNKRFLERIDRAFYYNHLTLESFPMQFYLNILPYFTEGLYYAFVSLPSPLAYELISFAENGDIESYTPIIGKNLHLKEAVLKGRSLNIADISKDLERINKALSMIREFNSQGEEEINSKIHDFTFQENEVEEEDHLNLEEARELCNIYTSEGGILELRPLSIFGKVERSQQIFTYRCKIIEVTVGTSYLRRFMLEKTDHNKRGRTISPDSDKVSHWMQNEYEAGNEKENGWIDFEAIDSQTQSQISPEKKRSSLQLKFEANEPASVTSDQLMTSTRTLMQTQRDPKKREIRSLSEVLESNDDISDENSSEERPKIPGSISSRTSSTSNSTKLSRAMNEAINTPRHPIHHRIFYGLVGLLFLSTLLSQIATKTVLKKELDNLEINKDVLRSAARRNDYLISINRRYRYLDGVIKGWYTLEDFTPNAIPLLISYAVSNTSSLAEENARLMVFIKSLDGEDQAKLFEKNVPIYFGEAVNDTFTSFQATEQIVQASLKVITLMKEDYRKSEEYLDFIFKNAVNDLLLLGEETTRIFLDSTNERTGGLKSQIRRNFGILLGFMALTGLLSFFIFYKDYCDEINNLTAFAKIDRKGVDCVSEKLRNFSKYIEEEVHFEDIKDIDRLNNCGILDAKRKAKKVHEEIQVCDSSKVALKYRVLVVKQIISHATIIALVALMLGLVGRHIDKLSRTVNQVYFLDEMIYKFDLAGSTYFDLLAENGTSHVRNQLTPAEFDHQISMVNQIQNSIAEKLKNDNGEYDFVIGGILFDDACNYLGSVGEITACLALQNGAENANFIQLINRLEALLSNMRTQYEQSNKTISSLATLILKGQAEISSLMGTITDIYQVMASRLDLEFSEQVSSYESLQVKMVVIIPIIAALICLMKYFVILRELERNLHHFRNALRLFPPRLILSNFMLKSFLIKTTSFNWFKADL